MSEENEIPRLSRLSSILILLQSKKILTAGEIAKKFGISKRTAYRDIKALEESGIPIYTDEGKGYSLVDGFVLPPIMFTEQEANALITAENIITKNKDQSLVENHRNAIDKVRSVLQYTNKDKASLLSERQFSMTNLRQEKTSDCLSDIQVAITNLKLIAIEYLSLSKEETTKRIIEPQAIYHTSDNWIMIAWCQMREDYREFRLDRIKSITIQNESFDKRNFDLYTYFKKYTTNK